MAEIEVKEALEYLGASCDKLAGIRDVKEYRYENEKDFQSILLSIIGWYKYICKKGSLDDVVSAVDLIDDISLDNPSLEKLVASLIGSGSSDTKKAILPGYGSSEYLEYLDGYMDELLGTGYYDLDRLCDARWYLQQILAELESGKRIRASDTWAVEDAKVKNYLERVSRIIESLEELEKGSIGKVG